jgi:hypothetical protein
VTLPAAQLHEVESVRAGKVTGTFQYRSTDALSPPDCCFSLIFTTWTMDLQVESMELRNNWVAALSMLVTAAKQKLELDQQKVPAPDVWSDRNSSLTRVSAQGVKPQVVRRAQSMRLPSKAANTAPGGGALPARQRYEAHAYLFDRSRALTEHARCRLPDAWLQGEKAAGTTTITEAEERDSEDGPPN